MSTEIKFSFLNSLINTVLYGSRFKEIHLRYDCINYIYEDIQGQVTFFQQIGSKCDSILSKSGYKAKV